MQNNALHPSLSTSEPGRPAPGALIPPRTRLTASILALAAIWLLILPAVAQISAIREMIARHEAHGVDPSAKYYSELPAMQGIIKRLDEIKSRDEQAFGSPSL